jgi:catechol 2,3-dioxygenase-like lactoylglutathione lyase family enzyme
MDRRAVARAGERRPVACGGDRSDARALHTRKGCWMKTVASFEFGLVAADIDALLPFYTEVLGLAVVSDLTVPTATSSATGLAPDGYRVVRLETNRGDRLKLACPTTPPEGAAATAYPMQRRGASYVTFIVDDLKSLYDKLLRARVAIKSEGVVGLRPGVSLVLATDPQGNWLEFLQYDDIHSYRPGDKRA